MPHSLPKAPRAPDVPLDVGTPVVLEPGVRFIDRNLVAGGTPWRLLRLSDASRGVLERWRRGDVVRPGEGHLARTLVGRGLLLANHVRPLDLEAIDVIIPVLNEVDTLAGLLVSLSTFHVTVVDDGSLGREVEACADAYGATWLRLETNEGPSHARNVAARRSSRPLLWFIDADVVLGDGASVATGLAAQFADPLVAAAAPRVKGVNGTTAREGFESRFSPLDLGDRDGLVMPGAYVSYVPSACLMLRRDAFGDGFDEALRVGEDVDLIWRLIDHGWNVRYVASPFVEHPARPTWAAWWRQRQRYGASSGALAQRHGDRLAPLRVDRWTLAVWLSILLGRPGVGAAILRAASERARRRVLAGANDPARAAREVVVGNVLRSAGPLARALVRTFGVALLFATLSSRLRGRAVVLFALGAGWRWRGRRVHAGDLALGVADDLAYGVGVAQGAWRARTLVPLTPVITKPTSGRRDVLGATRSPHT